FEARNGRSDQLVEERIEVRSVRRERGGSCGGADAREPGDAYDGRPGIGREAEGFFRGLPDVDVAIATHEQKISLTPLAAHHLPASDVRQLASVEIWGIPLGEVGR